MRSRATERLRQDDARREAQDGSQGLAAGERPERGDGLSEGVGEVVGAGGGGGPLAEAEVDHREPFGTLEPASAAQADLAVLDILAPAREGGDVEQAEKHAHLGVGDGHLGVFVGRIRHLFCIIILLE